MRAVFHRAASFALAAAIFMLGMFGVRSAFAATDVATSISDQPSTLVVSQQANHTFRFTLADGWTDGTTVTLTFPAGFITTSITEDDVDVTDNGIDLTTAPDCTGSEQMSVAMSSNILTMTVCAGDGGSVIASHAVTVEIGANAAASGSGTNKITNPSGVGTYYVNLAGTSGNLGSIPIPILSSGTSGVSAVVSSAVAPTPPPSGPPPSPPEPEPEPTPTPTPEPTPEPTPTPTPTPEPTPTPTPTPSPSPSPSENNATGTGTRPPADIDVTVSVSSNGIPLGSEGGGVRLLPGSTPLVRVTVSNPDDVSAVTVVIGDANYILSKTGTDTYEGLVQAPTGNDVMNVVVSRKSGGSKVAPVNIETASYGRVYETVNGETRSVENVIVTAYTSGGGRVLWDARAYGQTNPEVTTFTGGFGWYAPNGSYTLVFERDGYETVSVPVFVSGHVLSVSVEMKRVAEVVPQPTPETPASPIIAALPPSVQQTVTNVAAAATATVQAVQQVLSSPEAKATATVAAPVTAAVATSSTVVLASSFNLGAYLQYLVTSPLLLFNRRKRKAYGVVYNAVTKVPVELAIVRLFRASDNRLVKTAVTNAEGKYFLFVSEPGQYRLKVIKAGFVFPSGYLSNVKDDGAFLDVYTNQLITVTANEANIAANIPLDPSEAPEHQGERRLRTKRFLRVLQRIAAPAGVLLSVFVYLTLPSIFSGVMLLVQILSLLISIRLAWPKKPKGWGYVTETLGKSPLGNVIVRLFEPRYNKLVESTLTDNRGRYSFLLGPNEYYVSFAKAGFAEKIVRPIDYRDKKEPAPLTVHVALDKV